MFHISTHVFGNVSYVVCTTMIMVNSAINPFIYALLSQRFRTRIKEMISCTGICRGAHLQTRIIGVIFMSPTFVVKDFDKERGLCVPIWPEDWEGKTYSLLWLLLLAVFPVSLMTVLYCRVIYTLWFQRSNLNLRQQV